MLTILFDGIAYGMLFVLACGLSVGLMNFATLAHGKLLARVEGIGQVAFTRDDVTRYELVGRIVAVSANAARSPRTGGKE